MSFELHLRTREQGTVVECRGCLIAGPELSFLRSALLNVLRHERRLVLNLSGLQTIDAAGLGVLASAAALANEHESHVALCCTPKHIRKLIDTTQLSSVLKLYESESKALNNGRCAAA
ncbi:MAG TPA: STAS domain-containing protein [Candidatus Acidoferrales bacterium]|nr:STAS domain-containing protein [Candidatus Acidoferrales bacterium]